MFILDKLFLREMENKILDRKSLFKKYLKEDKTVTEIAKMVGHNNNTAIFRLLKKFKIPV